ncbi:MAG: hypothetical protein Q4F66_13805 [Clostridium sp.]|nr:hypothetical protein [Clostridium sp.]
MLYLSPILICISLNVLILIAVSSLSKKNISLNKASVISISIILAIANFISMTFGKLLSIYLFKSYSSLFGGVLLLFIGIYYLMEHKKNMEYNHGLDTSFYYDAFPKCRHLLLTPSLIDKNNSNCIEINESIFISLPLSIYSIGIFFAAGIASVSIPVTILLVFISSSLFLSITSYRKNIYSDSIFKTHSLAIIGALLLITGILEMFI